MTAHTLSRAARAEVLAARLKAEAEGLDGGALLARALPLAGRVAVSSSFGAEAAVLLALIAEVDRTTPVLFVDTGKHFPETLAYRDDLVKHLGLVDLRVLRPERRAVASLDAEGDLWRRDPDACCRLRKVEPYATAIGGFDAIVTGRKRYHGDVRSTLPTIETADDMVRLNPLATWTTEQVEQTFKDRDLPRHPLVAQGYPSIGCFPCTARPAPDGGIRDGRWSHHPKTECGIHHILNRP
ncbi:phosphoadenylyl-sulfate reductase [Roseospirillum parvum]|uniref:Adenosine 5'-phosphosulfate reductase n=1 Tax=Roseospirillum parvum TaxID=83401 RepID=A0A1G8A3C3_9PROT|nr:phosphoadenylyl-sulfate reductase [Roseospirillum parvum]SDH15434.1 phosphoadenosine phosphosulfate reductase [Roseospirillum parvum]